MYTTMQVLKFIFNEWKICHCPLKLNTLGWKDDLWKREELKRSSVILHFIVEHSFWKCKYEGSLSFMFSNKRLWKTMSHPLPKKCDSEWVWSLRRMDQNTNVKGDLEMCQMCLCLDRWMKHFRRADGEMVRRRTQSHSTDCRWWLMMDGENGSQRIWQRTSCGYRQGKALWDEVHR